MNDLAAGERLGRKFTCAPFIPHGRGLSGFRGEVKNVSANQRPGRPSCFSDRPEKTQTSQRPLPRLCFSGRSEKQDGRPGLWLAETFSTSPLKPLNGIQRNLTGSKISTSSTKFVFFRADQKNKMADLASDWLRHFWLLLWNRLNPDHEV